MTCRNLLLAVLLFALLLLLPLASTPLAVAISGSPVGQPVEGDTWIYNVTEVEDFYPGDNVTVRYEGVAVLNAEDWNLTEDLETYNYTIISESRSDTLINRLVMMQYYSKENMYIVRAEMYLILNNTAESSYTEKYIKSILNTSYPIFQFPLERGKTWNTSVKEHRIGYIAHYSGGKWSNETYTWENYTASPYYYFGAYDYWVSGKVINETTVSTGAGEFDTWLVAVSRMDTEDATVLVFPGLYWYSPEVKNFVYYNATGHMTMNLVDFNVSSYFAHDTTTMLMLGFLFYYQQSSQTNFLILVGGAGVAVIAAIAVIAYMRRR